MNNVEGLFISAFDLTMTIIQAEFKNMVAHERMTIKAMLIIVKSSPFAIVYFFVMLMFLILFL